MGLALSALCGLLLFLLLLLTVMSSLPLSTGLASGEAGENDPGLDMPQLAESPPIDTYYVITQRPLFNESRLPDADEDESGGEEPELVEEMTGAPDVELSGVIITPTLRMVTLKRKDNQQSLVAFEGKPIEADFGNWQVSSIEARAATLTSGGGEELYLEMKVHGEKIEAPELPITKSREEVAVSAATELQEGELEPLSRAEEIRQRIAERRAELQQEAEQAGQDRQQLDAPNDGSATQSRNKGRRPVRTNNENEQ